MTISPRYCNRLHKNLQLNPIKREIKEGSTNTFWSIYINPKAKRHKVRTLFSLNTFTYQLTTLPKSLTKASEELWPAPHRCFPTVVIFSCCFRSSIRESSCRTTVLIFKLHQSRFIHYVSMHCQFQKGHIPHLALQAMIKQKCHQNLTHTPQSLLRL